MMATHACRSHLPFTPACRSQLHGHSYMLATTTCWPQLHAGHTCMLVTPECWSHMHAGHSYMLVTACMLATTTCWPQLHVVASIIIIFQAARPSCAQPTPSLARERGGLSPRSRTGTASPCSSRLRGHPLDCVTTDTARLIASMLLQTAYAAFPFVARKAGFCWGLCAKKRAYMLLSFPQTSSPAQAPVNSQA